jgi:dihydrofolate synthase/folylpolyglutamate synthase
VRFAEAEQFLNRQRRFGWKFGLGPMRRALARLGHPERSIVPVVIAGSKGKGSTAAFLEAILVAAGHRPGLYTSPHLVGVRERIRAGGREIGARAFAHRIGELRSRLGARARLTHFEWLTLAGIEHFARVRARPSILEIGLGGRLDAVNAVDGVVTVISGIEREHVDLLGTRLAGIAAEKAGIMRRGVPCVIGAVRPAARASLAACAARAGARPVWLERETSWRVTGHDRRGLRLDLTTARGTLRGLRLGLLGRHQAHNAALAVLAAEELRAQGWSIPAAAVRRGLAAARWAGRCDYRPGRPGLLLDGAHTAGSARALADLLEEVFPRVRTTLVFGALRDKNCAAMAKALFPCAAAVHLVRPPEERGLEPEDLLPRVPRGLRGRCRAAPGTLAALAAAAREAGPGGLVVVAGSLFLVGEALALLPQRMRTVAGGC